MSINFVNAMSNVQSLRLRRINAHQNQDFATDTCVVKHVRDWVKTIAFVRHKDPYMYIHIYQV